MRREKKSEEKKRILEKAMESRAEEMEERARRKAVEPTPEDVEEMYGRFCKLLQDQGFADEEGNPTEKTHALSRAISMEQERIAREEKAKKKKAIRRNITKAAAVVLVAGGCLFGFCMTSEANKLWVMQQVESIRNAGNNVKINNSENRDYMNVSEEEAKGEIVEKLHVSIPEFYYIPEGMSYYKYEISEETGIGKLIYKYQDGYLFLYVSANELDISYSTWVDDEKMSIAALDGSYEVDLKNLSEKEQQYAATWKYKNAYYDLEGKISKEEIIKILEKMQYNL